MTADLGPADHPRPIPTTEDTPVTDQKIHPSHDPTNEWGNTRCTNCRRLLARYVGGVTVVGAQPCQQPASAPYDAGDAAPRTTTHPLPIHGCGHTTAQHHRMAVLEGELRDANRAVLELTAERDQARAQLAQVREAAHRRDLGINAERTQWQAEMAHLRGLIDQYGDDGMIPAAVLRDALRDGPPPSLGSPADRAQDVGRCGVIAPNLALLASRNRPVCRLPAGHAGWHRGDDRSEWVEVDPTTRAQGTALPAETAVETTAHPAQGDGGPEAHKAAEGVRCPVHVVPLPGCPHRNPAEPPAPHSCSRPTCGVCNLFPAPAEQSEG